MKLITKEIQKLLEKYPIYSQDGLKSDAVCIVKFFFPLRSYTWYILEANLDEGLLYGITINGRGEGEYGYTSLRELESVNISGLSVERDIYFTSAPLKDIDDDFLQKFLTSTYE